MSDPYKVLGVSPDSSDEQIKTAYRELAKKYHPDSYANNPLADLASERMQEINNAYDHIQKERQNGRSAESRGYSTGSSFSDVKKLIYAGRITEAEEILDGVPSHNRDAEWHYLKARVYYTRGWFDEATSYFERAYQMNPNNPEYRSAYNQVMNQRQYGQPFSGNYRTTTYNNEYGCAPCDVCSGILCASFLCDCLRCF